MDEREIGTDPSPVPTQVSSGQGRYRTGLSEKGPSAPQSRYRPAQPRCWRLRPRLWGGRTGPGETGTEAPAPGEGAAGPAPARGMAEPQTQREAPRGSGLKRTAEPADAGTARAGPGPTAEEDERGLAREGRLPPPPIPPRGAGPGGGGADLGVLARRAAQVAGLTGRRSPAAGLVVTRERPRTPNAAAAARLHVGRPPPRRALARTHPPLSRERQGEPGQRRRHVGSGTGWGSSGLSGDRDVDPPAGLAAPPRRPRHRPAPPAPGGHGQRGTRPSG